MNTRQSRRSYGGRSAADRARERRAQLIGSGQALIGRRGYAATTVKAICEEAGLTERYFYESFSNREALLKAVYLHLADALRDRLVEAAAAASPRTPEHIARVTLTAFYAGMRDDPVTARIIYVEIMGVSPSMDETYRQSTGEFAQMLLMLTRPLFPGGELPGHDAELLATGLVGAVNSILVQWMLNDFDKPLETVVETTMDIFTALTRHLLGQLAPTAAEAARAG